MDIEKTTPPATPRPLPLFEQLQQEMERVFDRFRGYPMVGDRLTRLSGLTQVLPAIDVAETETAIEITAEVPGMAEADLDVSVNGEMLVIKGEKTAEHSEDEKDYHLHERSFGSFRRQIPLGFAPADDAIAAEYKAGLLRLTVRKPPAETAKSRKIAINAA